METQIKSTNKGFVGQLAWEDGTKINSRPFFDKLEAQDWLLEQVKAQQGCIYRDTAKKIAAALVAIALLIPSLPSLAQYTPPPNGGPTSSGATGTR